MHFYSSFIGKTGLPTLCDNARYAIAGYGYAFTKISLQHWPCYKRSCVGREQNLKRLRSVSARLPQPSSAPPQHQARFPVPSGNCSTMRRKFSILLLSGLDCRLEYIFYIVHVPSILFWDCSSNPPFESFLRDMSFVAITYFYCIYAAWMFRYYALISTSIIIVSCASRAIYFSLFLCLPYNFWFPFTPIGCQLSIHWMAFALIVLDTFHTFTFCTRPLHRSSLFLLSMQNIFYRNVTPDIRSRGSPRDRLWQKRRIGVKQERIAEWNSHLRTTKF